MSQDSGANPAAMADGSSTSMPLPPGGLSVVDGDGSTTVDGSLTQQLERQPPPQAGRMNYVKLLKLFTNKHTCELYERQIASLRRMVRLARKSSTGGFAMVSLPLVQRILSLTCDNIRLGHKEFIDPACSILETLGFPFERVRANEEFHSKDIICDTLVVMSSIIDSPQCGHKIVLTATNALKSQLQMQSLADAAGTSASVGLSSDVNKEDLRPNMWQFKQEAVDRSGMIKIIMSSFRRTVASARIAVEQASRPSSAASAVDQQAGKQTALLRYDSDAPATKDFTTSSSSTSSNGGYADHFELMRAIISVLRELAYTKRNAEALTQEGAPLVLFRALELVSTDLRNETVELTVDVLWNLLEVSSDALRGMGGKGKGRKGGRRDVSTRFQLLERHRSTNCLRMLGKARVVSTLRSLLERSIVEGFRARDKELRNNILVAASLLTRRPENQKYFVNTGFLSLLLLYSCAQEVGLPTDADEHNFATQSEQDFELKRLMWQEIGDLCAGAAASQNAKSDSSSGLPSSGVSPFKSTEASRVLARDSHASAVFDTVRQAPLVDALLLYLDARGQAPEGLHWTKPQMRTLTIDACALLLETLSVPACVERFVECEGPCQVLAFIQDLALVDQKRRLGGGDDANDQSSASIVGNDNGFEQGKRSDIAQMVNPVPRRGVDPATTIAAMRLLARTCRIPGCAAMMGEMGAMKSLVALFSLSFGEQDDTTTEFRTICASIIADLCDPDAVIMGNVGSRDASKSSTDASADEARLDERRAERRASVVNQKMFRRAGGVDMARHALDMTSDELAIKGPRLCMSLVDLAWRSVIGNRRSEAIFIANDGVDTLLNLIEQVPSSMYRQLLGCLADLMRNPTARPYFRAWRSDANLYGAAVMCLRIWAAEEHRLGIKRGPAGVLTNLDMPLKGLLQSPQSSSQEREQEDPANDSDYDSENPEERAERTATRGVMAAAEQDPHALPINFPPAPKRGGSKFERLREALAAAKDLLLFGDDNRPGAELLKAVSGADMRIKVWALLCSVGWDRLDMDDDDQATEAALIVLQMAKKYREFAVANAWQNVKDDLTKNGVAPIRPDNLMIENNLESGFDLANKTRYAQLKYVEVLHRKADNAETEFYENIRQQQEQEIQAHLVTRKMVDPRAGRRRKMKLGSR